MNRRLGLFLLLAAACLYTYKLEIPETRSWPTRNVTRIAASSGNGRIAVTAAPDTAITALITRRCYGRNKEDAENAIKNVVVKDTVEGNELRLRTEMPGGNRSYGADYEITAPESTALSLSTSNGAISLIDMRAGADASTSNGEISLLNTEGRMDLSTSNGKVRVQVHCGGISAETSNGAIDCDLAELGATEAANLETSNGKVTLYLPADVSATFDAKTSNGDVTVTGFGTVNYETSERTHKRGQIGSGASLVTVATSNGDILIRAR